MITTNILPTVPAGDGPGGQPASEDPEEGGAAAEQEQLVDQPQPRSLRLGAAAPPADQGFNFPPIFSNRIREKVTFKFYRPS